MELVQGNKTRLAAGVSSQEVSLPNTSLTPGSSPVQQPPQQTDQYSDSHLTPTHQGCLGPKTQQEPIVSVTIESDKSTQHPPAPSTIDLVSFPTSPPDIRHLTEMVTNLQVKVADLEQEVLDQKCLHKSHIKVLQAQIFDLEANNKTLSDKLTSLADSQQNWKGGCKQNQKGQSSQKRASCYIYSHPLHSYTKSSLKH